MAGEGEVKSRAAAIHALADRNDSAALPALLKFASDSDAGVSGAACAALGRMGTDKEIEPLGRLVLDGKTPGAEAALHAVAGRARDKAEAAKKLVAMAQTTTAAQPQGLAAVFKTLIVLGGGEALNSISQSAASANPEVKDAAIRALANWPDFAAAKSLLAIAAAPNTTQVHNVLALQGVVRLVKSSDHEPAAARLDAAQAAWSAARRNEEKKLVLSAVASIPLAASAEFIKPLLKDPNFKSEAGLAGMALAEGLLKTDKPAAKALAQAVKDASPSAETGGKADAILKK
jgi:HEAT repeat protein